jgi:hypothetical protein
MVRSDANGFSPPFYYRPISRGINSDRTRENRDKLAEKGLPRKTILWKIMLWKTMLLETMLLETIVGRPNTD